MNYAMTLAAGLVPAATPAAHAARRCATPCPPDSDGNCTVGILDLLTLLANWGACA